MNKCVDCLHYQGSDTCSYRFIPRRLRGGLYIQVPTSCISRRLSEGWCGESGKRFVSKEKVKNMIGE